MRGAIYVLCFTFCDPRCAVSQRDSLEPTGLPIPEHPADPLPEPRCIATTRGGQPCRNRPLDGQPYCRVHASLAGADSAAPAEAFQLNGGNAGELRPTDAVERTRSAAIDAIEELEVDVRNQPGDQTEARDVAADALRLV